MEIDIKSNIKMSDHTTLKVGGVADYFVEVRSVEELKETLIFARQKSMSPLIIGGGSNILASDEGYRGLVIKNKITGISYEEQNDSIILTCGAGESLDAGVQDSVDKGYWGLENLSSIPGTIGATPIQNVGAYGVEVSSLIEEVVAVHMDTSEEKKFSKQDCQFSYRDSFFKSDEGRQWVVVQVVFRLSASTAPVLDYGSLKELENLQEITPGVVREKVIGIRSSKFPDWTQVGTAGSFFKNPIIVKDTYQTLIKKYPDLPGYEVGDERVKVSLGWVLDNVCNLKGFCKDGVCLYEKQALVLVTRDGATSANVKDFVEYVTNIVKEKTGINIEQEVRSV